MNPLEMFPATQDNPNGFSEHKLDIEGYMSYSRIKAVRKSPADYKRQYIDGVKPEDTDEKRFGRILHSAMLEPSVFRRCYMIPPAKDQYPDLLTTVQDLKAECQICLIKPPPGAKRPDLIRVLTKSRPEYRNQIWECITEDWEKLINDDSIIVSTKEAEKVIAMIGALEEDGDSAKLIIHGFPELWGYWYDKEYQVQWVAKLDYIRVQDRGPEQIPIIWLTDLKTTVNASQSGFAKEIAKWKYHIQIYLYERIVRGIVGNSFKIIPMFLAIEKTDPIGINTLEPGPIVMDNGAYETRLGIERIKKGHETGDWRKYPRGVQRVGLPAYYIYEIEAEAEREAT